MTQLPGSTRPMPSPAHLDVPWDAVYHVMLLVCTGGADNSGTAGPSRGLPPSRPVP